MADFGISNYISTRSSRIALVAIVALAALAVPAVASANITTTLSVSSSTTQASGHPNTTYSSTLAGSDKISSYELRAPAGEEFNWEAPGSKCSAASFAADNCASATVVGTASASIQYLFATTANGTIYVLTPESADTATIGIVLRPFLRPKIYLTTHVTTRPNDAGKNFLVTGFPTTSGGSSLTFKSFSMVFAARSGSSQNGPYFNVNPTSCSAAGITANVTAHGGATGTASSSLTPTGCASVPYGATTTAGVSNTQAGAATGANFSAVYPTADASIQNARTKSIRIKFAPDTGLNYPNLGALQNATLCNNAGLLNDTCSSTAPQSDIGDTTSTYPFLPPLASGDIYATSVHNALNFGIVSRGARSSTVVSTGGYAGVEDTDGDGASDAIVATVSNMPQETVGAATISMTAELIDNPSTCGSNPLDQTLTSWSGQVLNKTSSYTTTGC